MRGTDRVRRPTPSRRWHWRAGHRIDVGVRKRARVMAPTTQHDDTADHHGRQFDVRSRAVRSRSGMGDDAGQVRRPVPRRGAGRVT
jgi:hypothetical protein